MASALITGRRKIRHSKVNSKQLSSNFWGFTFIMELSIEGKALISLRKQE